MRLLPRSPRRRRRLLYASPGVALVIAIGLLFAFRSGGSDEIAARPGKAQVYAAPKAVHLSSKTKASAVHTLDSFIRSAALRRDLARSWQLASPRLRQGVSHAAWLRGNLPVYPYPARQFRAVSYRVTGTYAGRIVDVDALLVSKRADGLQLVYSCELHERTGGWLVDYCYPRKSF